MIGVAALTTYCSGVPAIGRHCGAPSNAGVKAGPLRSGTTAVCGIELAISASCACGVPATEARTTPAATFFGMRAKSAGSELAATKVQGPVSDGARYQRPESRV
ncbi:MAG: hypothetical protein AW07_03547 [Candidatus Accumulibacter sp. SK-11]|nr:MAG: hypothetical protein AW07_03547 [Candidatus Accumulibacter sp. SK-11]